MQTVRFYTNTGRYMGWKAQKNCYYLEIKSWLESGNYILTGYIKTEIRNGELINSPY